MDATKIIFQGVKFYWRTRNTIDIMLVEHPSFSVTEVVTYDPTLDREAARLYVDSKSVFARLDHREVDKQVHAAMLNSIDLNKEQITNKATFDLLSNRLVITEYSVPDRKMVVVLNGTDNFLVDKPAGLQPYQSSHYHTLMEGVIDEAMRAVEAAKAALRQDCENARKLEAIVQVSFTRAERWRIPIVFVKVCHNKQLKQQDAAIWQKVTSAMQMPEDAVRLATMLEPFGLTIPAQFTRCLSVSGDVGSACDEGFGCSSNSFTADIEIAEPSADNHESSSKLHAVSMKPAPITTSHPVIHRAATSPHVANLARLSTSTLKPASVTAKVTHKPTAKTPTNTAATPTHRTPANKTPTSRKRKQSAKPARSSAKKTATSAANAGEGQQDQGHDDDGDAQEEDGEGDEQTALHPHLQRLVDGIGSVASALRGSFRLNTTIDGTGSPAVSPGSKGTGKTAGTFSFSTASGSFSGKQGSDPAASYYQLRPAASDDTMNYVVYGDTDGVTSQRGYDHTSVLYGSGASVTSGDTHLLSVNEPDRHDHDVTAGVVGQQRNGGAHDSVGFDDGEGEDEEALPAQSAASTLSLSALSTKLSGLLFRTSSKTSAVSPTTDNAVARSVGTVGIPASNPYEFVPYSRTSLPPAGGMTLLAMVMSSLNSTSSKKQRVYPAG